MAQRHLFVERVAGQQHFDIPPIERGVDLDDVHRHRVTWVREGLAVLEHQRDVTRARAWRGQGITIDRGVAVTDVCQRVTLDDAIIFAGVHHVRSRHGCALAESFQLRAERDEAGVATRGDGYAPLHFFWVLP